MAGDPLYEPLGFDAPEAAARPRTWPVWALPLLIVAIGAGLGVALSMRGAGGAGEQAVAVASIQVAKPEVAPPLPTAGAPAVEAAAPDAAPSNGTTVEMQNGVKIVRFNPSASPASISIPVAASGAVALKPAPDARVSETTRWGTLPRIGPDGLRPAAVYARRAPSVTGPQVALILNGMGVDQLGTADAGRRLSPAIDFAFSPEVADAAAQAAESRRAGHEVLLAARAAPDAMPTVAATGGTAPDALASLHRRMARFVGYAGVVAASSDLAEPERQDVAERGLLLVGGAPSPPDAPTGVTADLVIDATQGHAAVAAALDRLVGMARSRGTALGVVDEATLAIDDVAALTVRLGAQGVTLVPVTALATERPAVAKATR